MQISSAVTALAEGAKRSGRLANHDRILSAGKTQIDMEGLVTTTTSRAHAL